MPPHGTPGRGDGPAELAGAAVRRACSPSSSREIYAERRFPIPADDEIEPALQEQLRAWCATFPVQLPLGVMQVFLSCWIRLYGLVCMEVFGHLKFALADAEPMFEAELPVRRGSAELRELERADARRPSTREPPCAEPPDGGSAVAAG